MNRRTWKWKAAVASGGLLVLAAVPFALAQMAPPTESQGVSSKTVGVLPLGLEFDRTEGRQLRMRVVTLAPGGVFAVHNHKDRPSVEYLLKGSATEFKGETSKTYVEGDGVFADRNTTHWWRNDGREPAVFIAVDVFNPPK